MTSLLVRGWRSCGAASRLGLRQLSTAATETSAAPPSVRAPRIAYLNGAQIHFNGKLRLDNIRDNDGAKKKEVRVGRGRGSGCGKTSGRGQKGQRARNSVRLGFEGGQTPLQKRLPKKRYFDPFERKLTLVTLGRIQHFIDIGRIEAGKTITIRDLWRSGCIGRIKDGVVLVRGGNFQEKIDLQVTECEPEAASQVLAAGGKITLAWYNKLGLRALLKPEKWAQKGLPLPRWARPPPKFEHRYPERNEQNLPIRPLNSQQDVDLLEEAWKRIAHIRQRKQHI